MYPPEIANILMELRTPQQAEVMLNTVRTDVEHLYRRGMPHHEELRLLRALEEHLRQLQAAQPAPPTSYSVSALGSVSHGARTTHEGRPPAEDLTNLSASLPVRPPAPGNLLSSLPLDQLAALEQSLGSIAPSSGTTTGVAALSIPSTSASASRGSSRRSPNVHPKRKDLRDPRTLREYVCLSDRLAPCEDGYGWCLDAERRRAQEIILCDATSEEERERERERERARDDWKTGSARVGKRV
jgi:hypothetical protein